MIQLINSKAAHRCSVRPAKMAKMTRLLLAASLLLVKIGWCSAATFTWTNLSSGDWFNANNWSPYGVPGPADTINVTNGTANLSSPVTINGSLNLSGGALTGEPLTISSSGLLNVSGSVNLENPLTNSGTVTMTGTANLVMYNNNGTALGSVYNLPGALWDFQTNAYISCGCSGHEFFNNAGTVRKSLGSGPASIQVNFINSGAVSSLNGALDFLAGATLAGSYNTAAGATINFAGGNFTVSTPPVITGSGLCEFTGNTLTVLQDVPANLLIASGNLVLGPAFQNGGAINNLTLNGATLLGTNTVTGALALNSGSLIGPLTVANGATLNIAGAVNLENVLTNAGTVTMTGTANMVVYDNNTSTFGGVYNLAGALWDIQTNAYISCACSGREFFNNAGTFRKSLGAGSAVVGISFTNSGAVTNLSGGLSFVAGAALTGTYDTASGATINFSGGNFTVGVPAPVITGSGLCEFIGNTLTLLDDVPANLVVASGNLVLGPAFQNAGAINNLTLNGATLLGTNTVTGTLTWNSGSLTGPLTVANGATLNITGGVSLEDPLTNAGTVTMTGTANMVVYDNGANTQGGVYNLAGALWDIQTNAYISCACSGHEFFNNAGTFRKSLGADSAVVGISFTNNGAVTNLSGTLTFVAGATLTGIYDTASGATTDFGGGNYTAGTPPPVITGSGVCEFTGNTLTLLQDVPDGLLIAGGNLILGPAFQNGGTINNLTLNGATLQGTNTVTGTLTWNSQALAGPLTVASGATLNITGDVSLETPLTNAGTVTMTGAGNMVVYNNGANTQGGVYNQAGALWDIQTNAYISCACSGHEFFNNAGTFRKSLGAGYSAVGISFTNNGTVNALAGTLNFSSGFTTAGGTLSFGVNSLSSFGQINLAGNAALGGTLSVAWLGGFIPAVSNSFALLDYGSHSGTFANISLPPGTLGQGNYGATAFTLLITGVTAQINAPSLNIQQISPGIVAVSWPASAGIFNLQTSANLLPGSWNNIASGITTVGTNYVLTAPVNGGAAFFRLESP